MRIRKLAIRNFRSHTETTINLDRITVIRAPNAGGKSSIAKAIELALSNRTDETSADGKGSIALIRAGQQKAHIKLSLAAGENERLVTCTLNGPSITRTASIPNDPQWTGEAKWLDWLRTQREVMACLTNNRFFVDLPEDRQKDILAAIILPSEYEWPEWVRPACQGLKIDWTLTPFEIIDQAYDAAFKERTNVNRDVKNFKMPEGDASAAGDLEALSHKVSADRQALDAAKKERFEASSEQRSAQELMHAAKGRLDQARARVEREEQMLSGIEVQVLPHAKVKELEKTSKDAAKALELEQTIWKCDAELEANRQAREKLADMGKQPQCPTCASPITEDTINALVKPLMDAKLALNTKVRNATDERKKLGNPTAAKADLEAHHRAVADLDRSRARIRDEQPIFADSEKAYEMYAAKLKQFDASALDQMDKDIAELQVAVDRSTEAVNRARAAKDLAGRKEKAALDLREFQKKQQTLEKLVAYFGTEVKTHLLGESIGQFADDMNAVLTHWGYECELSMEPYSFAIMFQDDAGNRQPIALKSLSKSQRYRFATAFQVALASTSGLGFVIVDEADIFDAAGRQALFEALLSGDLDQAIVLATDERLEIPDIEGVVFYRLDDVAEQGHIPTTTATQLHAEVGVAA